MAINSSNKMNQLAGKVKQGSNVGSAAAVNKAMQAGKIAGKVNKMAGKVNTGGMKKIKPVQPKKSK